MQYTRLKEQLKDFPVFSLPDIRKIESTFYLPRLNEWQHKGYIKKLRRGYYLFADTDLDERTLFFIANRLYTPSYISFEMALSYYGLIPEGVYGMTSATTQKTARFTTSVGVFNYRHLKTELLFGYTVVPHRHFHVKIAEQEKALLDYLYLHPNVKHTLDFEELRFDGSVFFERVNKKKLTHYCAAFHNTSLTKRLQDFLVYLRQQ